MVYVNVRVVVPLPVPLYSTSAPLFSDSMVLSLVPATNTGSLNVTWIVTICSAR